MRRTYAVRIQHNLEDGSINSPLKMVRMTPEEKISIRWVSIAREQIEENMKGVPFIVQHIEEID